MTIEERSNKHHEGFTITKQAHRSKWIQIPISQMRNKYVKEYQYRLLTSLM